MLNDMLKMTVDAMKKNKESNIGKLFTIVDNQLTDINTTLDTMEQWTNIDKAEGAVLDEIGADINQYRGQANDEVYRMMIRSKRSRSLSDGTFNKMIESLSKTLNCNPNQLEILSSIEAGEGEPSALVIRKVPISVLNESGMTPNQFMQFAEQVAPGDARITSINLEGTFRFSSILNEIETSVDGFSSNGLDGGTLGMVFLPENDVVLPI